MFRIPERVAKTFFLTEAVQDRIAALNLDAAANQEVWDSVTGGRSLELI